MKYRLVIPPLIEQTIRQLSPQIKRKIRSALEAIQNDPHLGKALRDDLAGLRSFRVSYYRIVYRVHYRKIEIQVIDIALRAVVYERVLGWMRSQKGKL